MTAQMANIGVIEGFFGPAWTWKARSSYVKFLSQFSNSFYIYAPKCDNYLRKNWQLKHPKKFLDNLHKLSASFKDQGIRFGIGLSPLNIQKIPENNARSLLKEKIKHLSQLKPDFLGIFFDDMTPYHALAKTQITILHQVKELTRAKILFCPTYYSNDPILDKVFGKRPPNYLEEIGEQLDPSIGIMWTGEKVISSQITTQHLKQVTKILKRKPFIWDNYFANDGPKQCYHLKFRPTLGRDKKSIQLSSGWGLNLMNQAHLSQIIFRSFINTVSHSTDPINELVNSIEAIDRPELSPVLLDNYEHFTVKGLKSISEENKTKMIAQLKKIPGPISQEIRHWLSGKTIVSSDCLTD